MNRDGTSRFAAAVIRTALEERMKYAAELELNPENTKALEELEDLEDFFFRSELFEICCAVCDMNPELIRKYLKENDYDQQRILTKSIHDRQKAQIKENKAHGATGTGKRNKSETVRSSTHPGRSIKDRESGRENSRSHGKYQSRRKKPGRSTKGN